MKKLLHKLAHWLCINPATEYWSQENKEWLFRCKKCGKFDI